MATLKMPVLRRMLFDGLVIPAHPLALTQERKLDERRQQALTRYYLAAGAGGIAVGVHTTQFEIHDPKIGLYRPVLELAAQTVSSCERRLVRPVVKIAGIVGRTDDAVREAGIAVSCGYHAGLLSLSAFRGASDDEMVSHAKAVSEVIPLFGFYLQPSVGGRVLGFSFWEKFCRIENLVAIKVAPFNRYQTIDVARAVIAAGRQDEVALYTGNDDSIIVDLLTPYAVGDATVRFAGGLLGHWAFWTKKAVELLDEVKAVTGQAQSIPPRLLSLHVQTTDANSAIFDAAHGFAGCLPGIHEVLRRQGLLAGRWCINPSEDLSPGQMEEIDRVCAAYPHLSDDQFVRDHLDEWLR